MNPDKPKRPSLREFDYFAERKPVALADLRVGDDTPEELQDRVEQARGVRRRIGSSLVMTTLCLMASAWLIWGQRDEIVYAFGQERMPRRLGDVTAFEPSAIPHNAYVELEGITEHRGLTQRFVRDLGPMKQEFWYYRLLGSQGVFVEVPPDAEKYGKARGIRVAGRAVDPSRTRLYRPLLEEYDRLFHPPQRPALRIIQVDVEPGKGRWPYIGLFAFVLLMSSLNTRALVRLYRVRQELRLGEGALLR